MAYQNNGYARARYIQITKGDQSSTYDITHQFNSGSMMYESITPTQLAQMSNSEYEARRAGFVQYLYNSHAGLQADCPDLTIGSVTYNTATCPLP